MEAARYRCAQCTSTSKLINVNNLQELLATLSYPDTFKVQDSFICTSEEQTERFGEFECREKDLSFIKELNLDKEQFEVAVETFERVSH